MTASAATILVIHDDPDHARQLTRSFEGWGWAVRIASAATGAESLATTAATADLALVNLATAARDDYAYVRQWRSDEALRRVPLVVMAGPDTPAATLEACLEHGAGDYLRDPASQSLLHARIQNVLQRRLLEEQAQFSLRAFNEVERVADDLRLVILPLGASLSVEVEFQRVAERIVIEAQNICNADGGVLYLAREPRSLDYVYVSVRSLDYVASGEPGGAQLPPPLPLTDPATGAPNLDYLATYVANTGESLNLADVHRESRFNLGRLTRFEADFSYETRSCLVVPLSSGPITGALLLLNCLDRESGEIVPFDVYHQLVTESLAAQAALALNNRLLTDRQSQLMRFKRELEIGREIQLSFLPASFASPPGWDVVMRFRPAEQVAGDFYDAMLTPQGNILLVLADVVGKGVPAALFMAIVRTLFRAFVQQHFEARQAAIAQGKASDNPSPDVLGRSALLEAARLTNAYLLGNHGETYTFVTLFACLIDKDSGQVIYVNAGHPPPLVIRSDGRHIGESLGPTGPAIGLVADAAYALAETRLAHRDALFAYTDGLTESRDAAGGQMGLGPVLGILDDWEGPAAALSAELEAVYERHIDGTLPFDDVTYVIVRREDSDVRAGTGGGDA